MSDEDRHVTRSGDDYADAFSALLPQGKAWPRDGEGENSSSVLMKVVRGLSQVWGFFEKRASALLEVESDPRITLEMLPDWERNWGLPDPCYAEPFSISNRQTALVQRMTIEGGQSRDFFVEAAAAIGYPITISEYRPFVVGIDRVGDNRMVGNRIYVDTASGNVWQAPFGVHGSWFLFTVQFSGSGLPGTLTGAVVGNFYMDTTTYPPNNIRRIYSLQSTGPQVWIFAGNAITGVGAPTTETRFRDQFGNSLRDPSGALVWDNALSEYPYIFGQPENRFYWTVHVGAVRLTWFRVGGGGGQTGVDPHLRIALATDLECLLNRWKPAHTRILYDYAALGKTSITATRYPFTLTGFGVSLVKTSVVLRTIGAGQGYYTLSGNAATLTKTSSGASILTAVRGNYSLVGNAATLTKITTGSRVLVATVGMYTETGAPSSNDRSLFVASGSRVLTGNSAILTKSSTGSRTMVAVSGSYVLSVSSVASISLNYIGAERGSYPLTVSSVVSIT